MGPGRESGMTRSLATSTTSGFSLEEQYSITAFDPDSTPSEGDRSRDLPDQSVHWKHLDSATMLLEVALDLAFATERASAVVADIAQWLLLNKRITFLRQDATEEGIAVKSGSEEDLRRFITSNRLRRPMVVLSDDGEFRAVWKGRRGERIAILFEGAGQGELLLFGAGASSGKRDDLVSRCRLEQMPSLIERFDLAPVWRHAC